METTALIFRYVLVTEIGTCVVTSRQVVSHHETMAMGRWGDGPMAIVYPVFMWLGTPAVYFFSFKGYLQSVRSMFQFSALCSIVPSSFDQQNRIISEGSMQFN
jgi:hypothetical protein